MANPLIDIIPIKARRYVYGVLSLAGLIYAAWEAHGHDWRAAVVSVVLGTLPLALAHANTVPPDSQKGNADEWQ